MSKQSNDGFTRCVCGSHIKVSIKKPTAVTPSLKKVACGRCKSIFMVKCSKDNEDFKFEFDFLHLSGIAEAMVQWRLDNPTKTLNISKMPLHKKLAMWLTRRIKI